MRPTSRICRENVFIEGLSHTAMIPAYGGAIEPGRGPGSSMNPASAVRIAAFPIFSFETCRSAIGSASNTLSAMSGSRPLV